MHKFDSNMHNASAGKIKGNLKMSAELVADAKRMNSFLLAREFKGPGDTIEAAAYRMQSKWGIHAATTMRLKNSEVKDMRLSSFGPILNAFLSVKDRLNATADRMERAYEKERSMAVNPRLLRLADAVRGKETQEEQTR